MSKKLVLGSLAFIPSVLALGGVLNLTTPANAFEVERSHHGASRIVGSKKAVQTAPKVKSAPQAKARRSTIFVRGNHGAQKIVTQEGVGGSTGEYKGFPKLEQRGSHGALRIVND